MKVAPFAFFSTLSLTVSANDEILTVLEKKINDLELEIQALKVADTGKKSNTRIKGLVQYDLNVYDGVFNNSKGAGTGSDIQLRRVHFRVFHKANNELDYVLLFFGSEENTNVLVGFARYQPNNHWEFRFGKIKEDRSLSLAYIGEEMTAERPMLINAFATAFQIGAQAHYVNDNIRFSAAIVEDKKYIGNNRSDGRMALGYNFRGTWNYLEGKKLLHLGGSYGLRQMNDEKFQLNSKAGFLRSVDNDILSSGTLDSAKHGEIFMAEFASQYGAYRLEAEYGQMQVKSALASQHDLNLDGYYVTLSYFLDGQTQLKYNKKYAKFGAPTNTDGVWEIYSRYSFLDLIDNNSGSKAKVYMLGTNYHFNANWHVQLQYYKATTKGIASTSKIMPDGDGAALRLSYRF